MSHDPDLAAELAELAASVRALAEWHESTGSFGMLTEANPRELLGMLAAGPAAGAGRGARPGGGDARAAAGGPPAAARPTFAAGAPPMQAAPARPGAPPMQAAAPMAYASMPSTEMGGAASSGRFDATFPVPAAGGPLPGPGAGPGASPSPGPSPFTSPFASPSAGSPARSGPAPASAVFAVAAAPAGILTPVTGSESPEERRVKLAMIAQEVRACTRCGLHAGRKQTVFARGNPLSELCFVGEGPGADEDDQGFPFVGKAGQLLDRMIAAMGYARDDVYICNIVKCRPPENRKPEPNEMAACTPYVAAQLALINPKVIVALGATAVEGLTGVAGGITRMRGKWKLYKGKTPLMPTFHPAYLLRQPSAKRDVWEDLKEVLRQLGKSPPAPGH